MTPWVYRTDGLRQDAGRASSAPGAGRARLRARDQGGHRSSRRCSSSAPSSACGSRSTAARSWAQFKGGDFPAVAVRDLAGPAARRRPRARDARPRHLDRRRPDAAARAHAGDAREGGGVPARRGRCSSACRRSAAGSRATPPSSGANPPVGAVITYYQRTRHALRPHEARDPRRHGQGRRHARAAQAARHQPRRVVDAASSRRACRARRRSRSTPTQGPRVVPGTLHACA